MELRKKIKIKIVNSSSTNIRQQILRQLILRQQILRHV